MNKESKSTISSKEKSKENMGIGRPMMVILIFIIASYSIYFYANNESVEFYIMTLILGALVWGFNLMIKHGIY